MYHQRRLYAESGPIAGVYGLYFVRNQSVGDVTYSGSTILFRQCRTEQAQRPHVPQDFSVELCVAIGLDNTRQEALLSEVVRGSLHRAFILGQIGGERKGVGPVKGRILGHLNS